MESRKIEKNKPKKERKREKSKIEIKSMEGDKGN